VVEQRRLVSEVNPMPLIRAIRDFIQRRMQVPEMSSPHSETFRGDVYHDLGGGAGLNWGGILGIVLLLIALPVIAFLVMAGVVYEGVIRVDRSRRLPSAAHWTLSLAITLIGLGIIAMVVLPALTT
jgi:hypothetical protein